MSVPPLGSLAWLEQQDTGSIACSCILIAVLLAVLVPFWMSM